MIDIYYTNIDRKHYINITPTPEFQITHNKERPWVSDVLEGCSDKEKAYINWMNRDILFAYEVREQCKRLGNTAVVNDGSISVDELVKKVVLHFGKRREFGCVDLYRSDGTAYTSEGISTYK